MELPHPGGDFQWVSVVPPSPLRVELGPWEGLPPTAGAEALMAMASLCRTVAFMALWGSTLHLICQSKQDDPFHHRIVEHTHGMSVSQSDANFNDVFLQDRGYTKWSAIPFC